MAAYIAPHPEITNVFISGGDSFLNSNQIIRRYPEAFSSIKHLDLIRFGTHTPVMLPMRIYDGPELLDILARYTKIRQIYVVTQFNHSSKLILQVVRAIRCLMDAGIIVKNQTALLKGINDDAGSLGILLKNLTRYGVIPYYVFQCRPISGVKSRLRIPLTEGCRIVEEVKNMQNGQGKCTRYAMPHVTDKIETLDQMSDKNILFEYHQAKHEKDQGRISCGKSAPGQVWLRG